MKRIVVALDHDYPEKAYRLVEEIEDLVDIFKIGPSLFSRSGNEIISFLHRHSKKIFLDIKLHDIPEVVRETIKSYVDLGVHYVTLHTLGGREMLEAAGRGCRNSELTLIGVTLLTAHRSSELSSLGFSQPEKLLSSLVTLSLESRLAGIIVSPQDLPVVMPLKLPGFSIFAAGIRRANDGIAGDDQKRISTPEEASKNGADFLIVGRPISQSPNPRETLREFLTLAS